jgi:hypothetical protein
VFRNFHSVPRGDSFNLPGFSFLSNRLRPDLFGPLSLIWLFGNSRAISIPALSECCARCTRTKSSVETFYWWLPGSGPAFRRSLPLGARRTLRVSATIVKSFLRTDDAPCRGSPNLPPRSTVKPQAQAVKRAQPQVSASLVPVGTGDRRAGGLDDAGAQRFRREGQWLAVDQGQPRPF